MTGPSPQTEENHVPQPKAAVVDPQDRFSFYLKQLDNTINGHRALVEHYKAKVLLLTESKDHAASRLRYLELEDLPLTMLAPDIVELKLKITDADIEILKIGSEISTLESIIAEKSKYFHQYSEHFKKDLMRADANWDNMVEKAKTLSKKYEGNAFYASLMTAIATQDVYTDLDKRVFIYKRLQALLSS